MVHKQMRSCSLWVNFDTRSLLESMAVLCVTEHKFTQCCYAMSATFQLSFLPDLGVHDMT